MADRISSPTIDHLGGVRAKPVQHGLWKIGDPPERLSAGHLESEKQLEEMIVAVPEILPDDWMLIGCQERHREDTYDQPPSTDNSEGSLDRAGVRRPGGHPAAERCARR